VEAESGRRLEDAWDFDLVWNTHDGPVPWSERGRVTDMGHAEFLEGGIDRREAKPSPFRTLQEVLVFDAVREYGLPDFDDLVTFYEKHYRDGQRQYPEQVFTGGYYKTIVSGAIETFGWEWLLMAAADQEAFERILDSIFRFSLHHYRAWARTRIEVFICHDDMVWTQGAFMDPAFYRRVIFPRYAALWKPLKDAGKKVLFCSDGDWSMFLADIADAGADGFIFEPMAPLEHVVRDFGRTNALPDTPGPAPMSHKAGAMGRSWHNGAKDAREGAVNLGLNFDEQWRRAMEVNPAFIFVTGWNEWIAGRYTEWSKYTDADCYYPGGLFVDQYTHEYSRDCEPMRGGHTDNYYYQLAAWVRRFKGVREMPRAKGPSSIAIDGRFDDWADVTPEYRDTIGDVTHRDHPGYGTLVYRNNTGRNDFVIAKAAYDKDNLYFFIQTREAITPYTDPHWMLLLIDMDQHAGTGCLGYDYVVNLEVPSATETKVKAWKNNAWVNIGAAAYRVSGNGMEVAISRALIGASGERPVFDFKWADNVQDLSDVADFGVNGDTAPNRRWNYRFSVAAE